MVTSKTQAQAPLRSLDQRMEALKRANDIRVRRAQLKKDLKDGRVQIEEILLDPPEYVSTAKVFDMLMAVPEVRAREGGAAAEPVPDQPVEDRRRPLRAAARRARWPLQPAERGRCPSSCHRPVGRRQGDADQGARRAAARARGGGLGDDAAAAARRGGRARVLVPHRGRVRRADRGGRVPRARRVRRRPALRDAALGDRPDRRRGPRLRARARARRRAARSRTRSPAASRSSSPPTSTSSSAGCASGRPRAPARSSERIALARHQLEQAHRFRYMVRNDDVERATEALCGDRRAGARRSQLPWPAHDPSPHR